MKNTIENPLKINHRSPSIANVNKPLNTGIIYELVDLSLAQSLQTEVEEQKRLLKEMAEALEKIDSNLIFSEAAAYNMVTCAAKLLTKYAEYINKQPK